MTPGDGRGRLAAGLGIARVLAGASVGALVLHLLSVPAGILLGSVIGGALANRAVPGTSAVNMPRAVRVVGFVLLGALTGVRLEPHALGILARVALPVLGSVAILLLINVALALVLVRRYRVDAMTAVLATAPGGLSEIVGVSMDWGARTSLVVAIHTVRVMVIVLVALPLLVAYLSTR
ncbi:AbrB family transcriptional regulator [Georgenia sp. Z1491]|uniref:AbrB family transcriptional regulator n=1 Tax=Georgenia sp. Z1491 TaxID=3416707 RepID=UPI003CEEAED6